jgi:hypothetical protein
MKKSNCGGYKIHISGKTSKEEILKGIAHELTKLEKDFGIDEFSGINFYCSLYKDNEKVSLHRKKDLDVVAVGFSIIPSNHKHIVKIEDNKKMIEFKPFDIHEVEESILDAAKGNSENTDMYCTFPDREYQEHLDVISKQSSKKESELLDDIALEEKKYGELI